MIEDTIRFAAALAAVSLLGCDKPSPDPEPQSGPSAVTQLDSIEAVREHFNSAVDKPRVLTILSPT